MPGFLYSEALKSGLVQGQRPSQAEAGLGVTQAAECGHSSRYPSRGESGGLATEKGQVPSRDRIVSVLGLGGGTEPGLPDQHWLPYPHALSAQTQCVWAGRSAVCSSQWNCTLKTGTSEPRGPQSNIYFSLIIKTKYRLTKKSGYPSILTVTSMILCIFPMLEKSNAKCNIKYKCPFCMVTDGN